MRNISANLTRVATVLFVSILLSANSIAAQRQEKLIRKADIPAEPFQIVSLKVKGKSVGLKRKFVGDDDWLKNFEVEVKNTSEKQIVYLTVEVFFPAMETLSFPLVTPLRFGKMPATPEEASTIKGIAPGKSVKLIFDEQLYENVKSDLKSKTGGRYAYDHVELRLGMTIFSDDTMWSEGQTLRRDPANPLRWKIAISPDDVLLLDSQLRYGSSWQTRFRDASLLRAARRGTCVMRDGTDQYQCGIDRCQFFNEPCYIFYDSYLVHSSQERNNTELNIEYSSCLGPYCNYCGPSQLVYKARYDPSCTWTADERPQIIG